MKGRIKEFIITGIETAAACVGVPMAVWYLMVDLAPRLLADPNLLCRALDVLVCVIGCAAVLAVVVVCTGLYKRWRRSRRERRGRCLGYVSSEWVCRAARENRNLRSMKNVSICRTKNAAQMHAMRQAGRSDA